MRKKKVIGEKFFNRDTLTVARELLGKFLMRRWHGKIMAGMITEVEAYDGFRDKASHASRGMTARNAPMFGRAGAWYVYFTYGMHWMLNVVTREKGYPAAILIRGAQESRNNVRLPRSSPTRESLAMTKLINGPARLTKYFRIDKRMNGKITMPTGPLRQSFSAASRQANRTSALWIEDRGVHISISKIKKSPRIGVDYAGKVWARKKWRFTLK